MYLINTYLAEKYNSMQTPIASIKTKFNKLPTPRYIRIENSVKDKEAIRPRLELVKSNENVNKKAINNIIKNKGIAPKVLGSTK